MKRYRIYKQSIFFEIECDEVVEIANLLGGELETPVKPSILLESFEVVVRKVEERDRRKLKYKFCSVRVHNALRSLKVNTVEDITNLKIRDLMMCRNFGVSSCRALRKVLKELGLHLKDEYDKRYL